MKRKRRGQRISYTKKEEKLEAKLWMHMVLKALAPYEKHE